MAAETPTKRAILNLPTLIGFFLVGTFIGLGSFTFYYAQGASYFSADPTACTNCHVMQDHFDTWQKASHHATATCNDCHVPHDLVGKYVSKAENGFWHSKGFTFMDFHEPIRIKPRNAAVLQFNCVRCHHDLLDELIHHGSFDDGSNACVRCHMSVGHGSPR